MIKNCEGNFTTDSWLFLKDGENTFNFHDSRPDD